jgi:hypothetical protein
MGTGDQGLGTGFWFVIYSCLYLAALTDKTATVPALELAVLVGYGYNLKVIEGATVYFEIL